MNAYTVSRLGALQKRKMDHAKARLAGAWDNSPFPIASDV